jgi:hypothetical protein
MWFQSLFASWKSGLSRGRRPRLRPAHRGTRLAVEHLEHRSLPSSFSAASVSALIADINAANTAGGANTITLTAPTTSPYSLTAKNNGGYLGTAANGLPVIAAKDNLTIVGNGDTIERTAGPAVAFRLLDVAPLASLTLQNLTLQGGLVEGAYSGGGLGGAIYNQGALTLSGVIVANNQAYDAISDINPSGGGGIWSNGSLTIENGTLVQGNIARGAAGESVPDHGNYPAGAGLGGAVYVAGGTANITNTTFTWNVACGGAGDEDESSGDAFGGALYVAAGQVILTNATVNNNFAYSASLLAATGYGGGGLYVAGGTVTLANDTVESNAVGTNGQGGPFYAWNGGYVMLPLAFGGSGGGLFIAKGATVYLDSFTVANTINNTDSTGLNGSTANIDGIYIET